MNEEGGRKRREHENEGCPALWEEFLGRLEPLDLVLSQRQQEQLQSYVALLTTWNRSLNLTAASNQAEILFLHLLDSLLAIPLLRRVLPARPELQALDAGSGAGLPGIPLAIAFPGLRLILLEATRKKAFFLEEATRRLGLARVEVQQERAETLAHQPEHRERYHLVLARALAPLPTLAELTLPFLQLQGLLLAYKGPDWQKEWAQAQRAFELLGGALAEVEEGRLPSGQRRTLLLFCKTSPTPPPYPRRPGMPAKRPL